jgi:hypothetical protein
MMLTLKMLSTAMTLLMMVQPSTLAQTVMLLTCVQHVPGYNFSQDTQNPN